MLERLNKLIADIKANKDISTEDKKGILKVAEYLQTREDMEQKCNNEEKNLIDMWNFIKDEVRTKAVNNVVVMQDEDVYSIAIHYFDESNENLKIEKSNKKTEEKSEGKTTNKKTKKTQEKEEPKNIENAENTVPVQERNDNDIVMMYKGKPVTYKEFKDGTYLQLS